MSLCLINSFVLSLFMLSKSLKPRVANANKAAAAYFGFRPLSYKVTTNPESAEKARRKQARLAKVRVGRAPLAWFAGTSA
jgi:hypothetical protein